jgi:thiamine pyrophosphokinase
LAVTYAIEECNAEGIIIYGGLPQPDGYETDHFLGNLKLMRFGLHVVQKNANANSGNIQAWKAEMRDARQTIYFVMSELNLIRKNEGLQRVSLLAEHADTHVENSESLRWNLAGLHVDPDLGNALRNEFIQGANSARIRLAKGSDPVYVIHNWYDMQGADR